MFIRYNESLQYYEYDSSGGSGAGPWIILPFSQIKLANTVISSDSTVIDYFQEGIWSPIFVSDGGTAVGQIYDIQTGQYTRIGRCVMCDFDIRISNIGVGGSGNLYIGNFPFTISTAIGSGHISFFETLNGSAITLNIRMVPGSGNAVITYKNVSSPISADGILQYAHIKAGTNISGSATYFSGPV